MDFRVSAPRYKIEVRLTNTKRLIQKIAKIVLMRLSYLNAKNCGMVNIFLSTKTGRKYLDTTIRINAAIHSYVAIPSPMAKPDPDIPINCSAEILAAIIELPTKNQGSDLLAKK